MKFTEEKLEKAFTELVGQEGFPHHLGNTMTHEAEELLIEEVFTKLFVNTIRRAMLGKYTILKVIHNMYHFFIQRSSINNSLQFCFLLIIF